MPKQQEFSKAQRDRNRKKALDFLEANSICSIATVGDDGSPYVVIVHYQVNDKLEVSFVTQAHTRLCQSLRRRKIAMLLVYNPAIQTSAQISGDVSELVSGTENSSGLGDHNGPKDNLAPEKVAFVLRTSEVCLKIFRSSKPELLKISLGSKHVKQNYLYNSG